MKSKIQIILVLGIIVTGIRLAVILYERHEANTPVVKQEAPPLNPDYYVTPKKLYPYDLKSAKQLTKQPVWVKEGYRYTYYPYQAGKVDFGHDAGLLLPIDRLEIKDVVTAMSPGAGGRKQMMAVFQKEGESYAVPIGFESDEQFKIYS